MATTRGIFGAEKCREVFPRFCTPIRFGFLTLIKVLSIQMLSMYTKIVFANVLTNVLKLRDVQWNPNIRAMDMKVNC